MQFYTWMKRKYIADKTAKGNLARSMKADGLFFPKAGRKSKVLKYLRCREASENCIKAFEECWEEYLNAERERH